MRLAVEGGNNFMKRLQALADAKAAHDESLAELNLGKTAKAALDDAQAKQAEAAAKLAEASATLETAKQNAAETVANAKRDAAETRAKAKADADVLTAEAQRIHGEAQQTKAGTDTALAAANAERAQLRNEREAANRMAEEAERTRAALQDKTDRLHEVLAHIGATAPTASAAVLAS